MACNGLNLSFSQLFITDYFYHPQFENESFYTLKMETAG